ncbi:hypothetical protein ACFVYP_36670 [Kitasatospora sp. NPDC058201]|uniref:hypothetical protein n=1 Tax=unclassified Kitasatospora TaxID=2633591 RepID=UPI003648D199
MAPLLKLLAAIRRSKPSTAATPAASDHYGVSILLNVTTGPRGEYLNFFGYLDGQPLARAEVIGDGPLVLTIRASSAEEAADLAFIIGNSFGADEHGLTWPGDLRVVSVGDVLSVVRPGHRSTSHFAVASDQLRLIDTPTNIVPLLGSSAMTRTC